MTAWLDEEARVDAVHERERNVVVEASAGTGKTKLVVDRVVELIAPSDGRDPVPIERIAAITFTRKAAGELRVRTRQRLLAELATAPPERPRSRALRHALGGIDTAEIGTIHGFADHLLRKWPAHARLDPRYELEEDVEGLAAECYQLLVHGAETGTLGALLGDAIAPERVDEATATVIDAQRAGLRMRSFATEHFTYHGLDGLVAALVLQRDLEVPERAAIDFDRAAFARFRDEYLGCIEGVSAETPGGKWLVETGDHLRKLATEHDPAVLYRELVERLERGPHGRASALPRKAHDFPRDERGWDVWNTFIGDTRKKATRATPLRDDLLAPLRRWLATRLSRLRPVVLALYELVKRRQRVVDHVDLLLRLRDLLRADRTVRHACQALFDHILVDEFQDTDPLQAEIVLFLCERGAEAPTWDTVRVAPGTLTIVGDPKQSIYRFRRADLATYDRVIELVEQSPHLSVRLTSSFRSTPGLVDWLNTRFADLLGVSEQGERFRRDTGEVFHQPLTKGRTTGAGPAIHALPIDPPDGGNVAGCRALEASTIARYLRWLVLHGDSRIIDPVTQVARPVQYGDIGVLAMTTTSLPILFSAFDGDGVPYAARGGSLFLDDPLHRRFLLALCAIADRDDGVATAALLRPPFFAVDLGDLTRARPDDPDDRVTRARAIVRELRRRRFERGPGATARALLDDTGLGRMLALGPNGSQRLSNLRELCFQLELRAAADQLDFDAAAERLRDWIDDPPGLDPPHPVSGDAVRVLTIHQSKGLEFPVVVLWDGRALWTERVHHAAWSVDRDGRGWAMRLDPVRWEESSIPDLATRECRLREAERKRLVYVAATRARDVLVIPRVGAPSDRWLYGTLLGSTAVPGVVERARHTPDTHATWFDLATPPPRPLPELVTEADEQLRHTWQRRAKDAMRPRATPIAFTSASSSRQLWGKLGRFGTVFGETIHVAIGIALRSPMSAGAAVASAAARTGLRRHLVEATDDVARALASLRELGVPGAANELRLEYPVAGLIASGELVAGYVDLVAELAGSVVLLDFKTDAPPIPEHPVRDRYISQVQGYANVLSRTIEISVRAGLLFTADGGIRWLPSGDNDHPYARR